ncbi:nucleolar transcription factor 1-B-like [Haliotis rubra]|uniref:nucleolar transcription factor 1-B-like n=1 Tax=Haliotis rubra TaxID=36100 RepID=UPI001EE54186|nr:nucleolar transcription factor 1-B-like [Haliotis rubra]
MSIWRSHNGPTQREKFVRGERSFQNWLARNKTFSNEPSDAAESEGAGSSKRDDDDDDEEEEEEEEEYDDDDYLHVYFKQDWGSANGSEENDWDLPSQPASDTQTVPVTEDETSGESENWDEEIEDQFSSNTDAAPVYQHPTWAEAHQPTKDLQTLLFAFDLHVPSIPRNMAALTFPEEPGQYDDADE